jgi:hypothetical protein
MGFLNIFYHSFFKADIEFPEAEVVVLIKEAFAWVEVKVLQTYLPGRAITVGMFGAERFAMYLEGVLKVIAPV